MKSQRADHPLCPLSQWKHRTKVQERNTNMEKQSRCMQGLQAQSVLFLLQRSKTLRIESSITSRSDYFSCVQGGTSKTPFEAAVISETNERLEKSICSAQEARQAAHEGGELTSKSTLNKSSKKLKSRDEKRFEGCGFNTKFLY